MINQSNLKKALLYMGFQEDNNLFTGQYGAGLTDRITVDFQSLKIKYPENIRVNQQQTTNFSDNENFVVLECVWRLLQKGYRPEHLELEKKWSLGHTSKGGRADICIYDETGGKVIAIIECKTAGREYYTARKKLLEDGGQLFSYWQQEGSSKWLCLYASDFDGKEISYETEVITAFDDPQKIKQSEKDTTITLYKEANTVEDLFAVWKETYSQKLWGDLIFDKEATPYTINVLPLRKKHLKEFGKEDNIKIVNEFEEILRHNNISDKENAFNRLIALFICKLVDEYEKREEDIVDFQYRQGSDTYETLQDRLQRLHQQGMEKFMKEDIFYVPSDYPSKLFSNYTNTQRKRAIEDLEQTIKILKFYSNNDFAFKDVHNEELFLQNSKILIEVVQLFERYRIVYKSKHQFLGDLFEQLLNKGFKQNEGQFFTPMPITRFIWDSIPLKKFDEGIVQSKYPKIIDYACGSGHFLTEAVTAVNAFLSLDGSQASTEWVRNNVFGVEKDYRLARVSKVSLFMNGAGEGTIVFGDGLDNVPNVGILNNMFDILVSNPPYSVKAFKQHLNLKNNSLDLLDSISASGSEIEVLFIERAVQLLKPGGIAAIILPSSFLSNDSNSYNNARKILINNFKIRAIVRLGSKTFAATGTNTVILFLEKYDEPPKRSWLVEDSVEKILSGEDLDDWEDVDIVTGYTDTIDIDKEEYLSIITGMNKTFADLEENNYFKNYVHDFLTSDGVKKTKKTREFKSLNDQEIKLLKDFYKKVRKVESQKLKYFALTYNSSTIIITAPSENKFQKEFLGYDWSNRKGNEGIQIINPGGKLYDENDRHSDQTLAAAVRNSYEGHALNVDEDKIKYVVETRTCDMINFTGTKFVNSINLVASRKIEVNTVYPMKPLSAFEGIVVRKGSPITEEDTNPGDIKVIAGGKSYAYMTDKPNRDPNIVTISASGASAGFVNYWSEPIYASDCTTVQAVDVQDTLWIYYYLKYVQKQIMNILQRGSAQPHVYPKDIEQIPVPVLNREQQRQIVYLCHKLEDRYLALKNSINNFEKQIEDLFHELDKFSTKSYHLSDDIFNLRIGKRVVSKDLTLEGNIPVYSANVFEPFGYIDKYLIKDFEEDSILWGIDGDWMVNILPRNIEFYPTDHCGVLRVDSEVVLPRYMAHLLKKAGNEAGFSRSYRPSKDRVKALSVKIASIQDQQRVIPNILELEEKVRHMQNELVELDSQRENTMDNFLKSK